MILIDTNYFLRAIVLPRSESEQAMTEKAQAFFIALREGKLQATTTDAVLAEVFYVLTGSVYTMNVVDVIDRLRPLLQLKGLLGRQKAQWNRALDLLAMRPNMKFVDALLVAIAENDSLEVATFDRGMQRYSSISINAE